ncbi:hypothetical protein U27_05445 [Candidatus Vecturithrix granuli]|uniref:CAAX prenyl protease 2/Lysostaphin resistance protein A-like domain-containing protein n=1 Tax=Vecturithrix granuli TaxID=1499967 RepID=A0A081C1L6_VECG1|nr:hypothetical protein U27_05445 [Candidatus Vecturithrix granuli]
MIQRIRSIFQSTELQAIVRSTDASKSQMTLISLASLPILWGLFQGYHLICKLLVPYFMSLFPYAFDAYTTPYYFGIALVNLIIWSILAALWPRLGLGDAWHPDWVHSIVVMFIASLCVISVSLIHALFPDAFIHSLVPYEVPFKRMGFVVWTMTPVQEEILFRGFLYALTLQLFHFTPTSSFRSVLPAFILGAAWFALWHVTPYAIMTHGWYAVGTQAIVTFFAGILFNALRHWTGSIWLVIPVHAAGNFFISMI